MIEPKFVTDGWYAVRPGESAVVYSGDQAEVYVLALGADGQCLALDRPDRKLALPVSTNAFSAEQNAGSKATTVRVGRDAAPFPSPAAERLGFRLQDGFYRMPSNLDFLIPPPPAVRVQEVVRPFHVRATGRNNGLSFVERFDVPPGARLVDYTVAVDEEQKVANVVWKREGSRVSAVGDHTHRWGEQTGSHFRGRVTLRYYYP